MNTMVDLKIRSWVKSFTWRIIGVLILLPLTYVFTGNWESAGGVTLSFNVIRMLLYYFHERAWENISWRKKGQDFILCHFDTANSLFCIGNNIWIRLWALNMSFCKGV